MEKTEADCRQMTVVDCFRHKRWGREFTVLTGWAAEEMHVGEVLNIPLKDGSWLKREMLYFDIGFVRGSIQPKTVYAGDSVGVFVLDLSAEDVLLKGEE